jgi:hypothetical protein
MLTAADDPQDSSRMSNERHFLETILVRHAVRRQSVVLLLTMLAAGCFTELMMILPRAAYGDTGCSSSPTEPRHGHPNQIDELDEFVVDSNVVFDLR